MSEGETDEWRAVKADLVEHGVPERRAEIAARVAAGQKYRKVAEEMGVESRGSIGNQVEDYRKQIENSGWLVENAPEI